MVPGLSPHFLNLITILAQMACINCGAETSGTFCSTCGQKTTVKRITIKEGWYDFWSRVYGFDGMFPRTLRDLTIRPGTAAKKFIAGNRVAYYGPVGYFFLMITVYLLVLGILDYNILDFMKGTQESMQLQQSKNKLTEMVQGYIADNIKVFMFLIIPFQAWCARYLFFRKNGYNFIENMVLPLYVIGHQQWLSIVMAIVYKINGFTAFGPGSGSSVYVTISSVLSIIYFCFAYADFMRYQSRVKAFFKSLLMYATSYLLFIFMFTILMLFVVVAIRFISPETFEAIRPSNNR
jgi:hypothetical protein